VRLLFILKITICIESDGMRKRKRENAQLKKPYDTYIHTHTHTHTNGSTKRRGSEAKETERIRCIHDKVIYIKDEEEKKIYVKNGLRDQCKSVIHF